MARGRACSFAAPLTGRPCAVHMAGANFAAQVLFPETSLQVKQKDDGTAFYQVAVVATHETRASTHMQTYARPSRRRCAL